MGRKVYLVGGGGYVGSRLDKELKTLGWETNIIDLGLFGRKDFMPQDVLTVPVPDDGWPVVWLASVHDATVRPWEVEWSEIARKIMVHAPLAWVENHPMVYVSSMRAVTGTHRMYGAIKRLAEIRLLEEGACCAIVRPGTVWGGFDPELPNRTMTAINKYIITGEISPEYSCWTINMSDLVARIVSLLHRKDFNQQILNVTDFPYSPTTFLRIEQWDHDGVFGMERAKGIELGEEHPMKLFAEHYGLEFPQEAK